MTDTAVINLFSGIEFTATGTGENAWRIGIRSVTSRRGYYTGIPGAGEGQVRASAGIA